MKVRDSGMPEEKLWESFFNPEEIIDKLLGRRLKGNAAEFGCGYGTFTMEIARRTGGCLYAFDIEEDMTKRVKERINELPNVEVILRDLEKEGTGLEDEFVQAVTLFNLLHGHDPLMLLREAFRILPEGGKIAAIHWRYDASTPRGPEMSIRPKPEDIQNWMLKAGFEVSGPVDLPPYHYGIVGIKGRH
ncbi:MAG TPA: class I SAM-dependent methyltransferase [Ignavibacteriales bacterium]|nr:class I SAM-dependent methyltransferase [Ignavibacteriales bacterium]